MIKIDKKAALKLLTAAVRERGEDHVYDTTGVSVCQYVRDGQPDCLIGLALHKAGVSLNVLSDLNIMGMISIPETLACLAGYDVQLTPGAVNVFAVAQNAQDAGRTWGYSVNEAKSA